MLLLVVERFYLTGDISKITCTSYCQLNGNNPDFGIKQGTHNQLDLFICCFSNGATNCHLEELKGERVAQCLIQCLPLEFLSTLCVDIPRS